MPFDYATAYRSPEKPNAGHAAKSKGHSAESDWTPQRQKLNRSMGELSIEKGETGRGGAATKKRVQPTASKGPLPAEQTVKGMLPQHARLLQDQAERK